MTKYSIILIFLLLMLAVPVLAGEQYFEVYLDNETPIEYPTTIPVYTYPTDAPTPTETPTVPPTSATATVTVTPTPTPGTSIAEFSCTPLIVVPGEITTCSELTETVNASLTWYWGDGNTTYATGAATHAYLLPGNYTVTVRHVTGSPANITTLRKTNYIQVVPPVTDTPTPEPTDEITATPSPEPTPATPVPTPTGRTIVLDLSDRLFELLKSILDRIFPPAVAGQV